MAEIGEKPLNNGKKTGKDPITGKFVEGNTFGEGKPLGTRSFTTKVREALEKIADGKDYTYEAAFIKAILKKAIVDQDVSMMRTVWEQLDGKPIQRIGGEEEDRPIQVEVTIKSILEKVYGEKDDDGIREDG